MEIQESTPVGDLAASSSTAASVLENHGIDYCCGGKRSLEDACREKGLSTSAIKDEIAQAVAASPASSRDWKTAPLTDLVQHIMSKHHEYLKLELPRVGQRVRTVVQVHGEQDPETLQKLGQIYQEMADDLHMHMHKEEMMLFSAIEEMEAAVNDGEAVPPSPFGSIANPIAVMEREHADSGDALGEIRKLTNDFAAPSYACSTYHAMLEGLKALEADLHIHIHLENNILFPRAIAMEGASA